MAARVYDMVSFVDTMLLYFLTASVAHTDRAYLFSQPLFIEQVARHHSEGVASVLGRATHLVVYQGSGLVVFNTEPGSMANLVLHMGKYQCFECERVVEGHEALGAAYCLNCHQLACPDCVQDCHLEGPKCSREVCRSEMYMVGGSVLDYAEKLG